MSPEAVALVGGVLTLLGILGAAMIAGIFGRANARDVEMRTTADKLIDTLEADNKRLRQEVHDLEAKVAGYEGRPTRRPTP